MEANALHVVKTRVAPIGGLNAKDSIAAMPEQDALRLINWIPDTNGIRCRRGYKTWASGMLDGSVKSILPYFSAAAIYPGGDYLSAPSTMPGALFAATDGDIYDITSSTATPASAIALSSASDAGWFSSAMLANSAGSFLLACSEADGYFTYDGTTWLKRVAGVAPGEVTGVDPADLVHVSIWKRKAWFVERDTTKVWYLTTDAIAGVAVAFDFGPLLKRGGSVAYTASWTIDAGEGIDDFFVVVSSNGEILVYKGTDPAAAATFALVGAWSVGQIPVGRRAYAQYGGDLVIVSTDGITPLSAVTRGGQTLLQVSSSDYTSKIRPLIGKALQNSFTTRGWELLVHPSERIMICNTPDYAGVVSQQFVMSIVTNAWCLFNDISIVCMGSIGGYTFAGTANGIVYILFSVQQDAVPIDSTMGVSIEGSIIPAYSNFGAPVLEKIFHMARPSFISTEVPGVLIDIIVDYKISPPVGSPNFNPTQASLWDSGVWDSAVWGGEEQPFAEWAGTNGVGYAGTATMLTSCVGDTTMASIDYMIEAGGPL